MEHVLWVVGPLAPALLSFGPLFMMMPPRGDAPHRRLGMFNYVGLIMLVVGLAWVYIKTSGQELEIRSLQGRIESLERSAKLNEKP
jgi:hypothetical protein